MAHAYWISVVDSYKARGYRVGGMASASHLVANLGVPVRIAKRWERERYLMTTGLRRRVKQDVN